MSVLALIVPIFIAAVASLVYAAISGAWTFRSVLAMFAFGLCILMLPLVVHA